MFDTAPGSVTTVEAAAIFGHWSTSSSVPLSSDLCNGAKRCNERSPFAMFKEFSLACLRKSGALPSLRRCQPSNHSPGHIWVGPRMGDIDHKTVLSFKWLVRNNLILLRVKSWRNPSPGTKKSVYCIHIHVYYVSVHCMQYI